MNIRDAISHEMEELSKKEDVVFLGENVINSGRIYGTLDLVPTQKCIEMPAAENLIAGVAMGLALVGYKPVCIFQRMDFMLNAFDSIFNHAFLWNKISGGKVNVPVIFRVIKTPLQEKFYQGLQHSKDLTPAIKTLTNNIVEIPSTFQPSIYKEIYEKIKHEPIIVVEDRSTYEKEV